MIRKNFIENKKGDIPVTILVIGVLAICSLAIFSFYTSRENVKSDFGSVGLVERSVIEAQKISLYQQLGFSQDEIDSVFGLEVFDGGRRLVIEGEGITVKYTLPSP